MKKLLICMLGLFLLWGCKPEEIQEIIGHLPVYQSGDYTPWGTVVADPELGNPYPLYVFPSVIKGQDDFALHFLNPADFRSEEEMKRAPGYSRRMIVAAVYPSDCPSCPQQIPYLERLAKAFSFVGLEVVVLFADNDPEVINSDWVRNLQYVKAYYNYEGLCLEKVCHLGSNEPTLLWIAFSRQVEPTNMTGFPLVGQDGRSYTPQETYQIYEERAIQLISEVTGIVIDNTMNEKEDIIVVS